MIDVAKQGITILGSTGSVGQSTLAVLSLHPEKFSVIALCAGSNVSKMAEQCLQFCPQQVAMVSVEAANQLRLLLVEQGQAEIEVTAGPQAIIDLAAAQESSVVMSAIVGAAGLLPTLAAVKAGKRVLIANKEPLVMTGDLFMHEARKSNATILPIDSEHNAIFQCLPEQPTKVGIRKIHLTGSGGPFRGRNWSELAEVTPEQACAHPNWSMGPKISVDSATMMNKGLELIEATSLFSVPEQQVDIVIHPQSIVHSMVEYVDGSFLAQLGSPDMKIPIAHALAWPERVASGAASLNLAQMGSLEFIEPDMPQLPCLRLARQAAKEGGSVPAILNAANEVAVEAFLHHRLRFIDIPKILEETLTSVPDGNVGTIEGVLHIDNKAREYATRALNCAQIGYNG